VLYSLALVLQNMRHTLSENEYVRELFEVTAQEKQGSWHHYIAVYVGINIQGTTKGSLFLSNCICVERTWNRI
jgi:hypothetical protein